MKISKKMLLVLYFIGISNIFNGLHGDVIQCGIPRITPKPCKNTAQPGLSPQIINGIEATPGSWPWHVRLFERFGCGGALISKYLVFTAANCVFDLRPGEDMWMYFGDHDKNKQDDYETAVRLDNASDYVHIHPMYQEGSNDYDFAYITLRTPVEFNDHIMPVCLPDNKYELYEGHDMYVTGWGNTHYPDPGLPSDVLMQANVPYYRWDKCKFKYRELTKRMICAGDAGKDACIGDSGGPLVLKQRDGKFYLFGMVSFGNGCNEEGYPGVYSDVLYFV